MKPRRRTAIFSLLSLGLVLLLALTACGASSEAPMSGGAMTEPAMAPPAEMPVSAAVQREESYAGDSAQAMPTGSAGSSTANTDGTTMDRMIVKNAYISVQVESVDGAESALRTRAEQLGGYVVSVATYGSGDEKTSTLTLRVPADQFEAMLGDIEGLAKEVLSRSVSGDDVTQEYVDLESQLRNQEATRDRLLELLDRATRVEDALQVNQALSDVQGQIEMIQGRMKYLSQSSAMSTVTVELQPVPPLPTVVENDTWQPLRTALSALSELVSFFQALADVLIIIAIWLPIWLPLILLLRWLVRRAGRSRAQHDRKPQPPTTPPASPPANPPAA